MKAIIWDFNDTLYNSSKGKLYENAFDILQKAKENYYQALVTTSIINKSKRRSLIKEMGIWDVFDYIKLTLKTTSVFKKAVSEVKCVNEDVFVIGDSYSKEIRIGNKLGMKTVWFNQNISRVDNDKLDQEKCTHIVNNFIEISSILNLKL